MPARRTSRPAAQTARKAFYAADRRSWRAWLQSHHASEREVWLLFYKKHTGRPCISLGEAVEEALCFGWIDGKLRSLGDRHIVRFTPRRPNSVWAESNRKRVRRLMAAGLMTEAGLAAVRAAKKNGAWSRIDPPQLDRPPRDLLRALALVPAARRGFDAFPPSHRRMYVAWLLGAKRPETRPRRIAEIVRRSARGPKPS